MDTPNITLYLFGRRSNTWSEGTYASEESAYSRIWDMMEAPDAPRFLCAAVARNGRLIDLLVFAPENDQGAFFEAQAWTRFPRGIAP